MELGTNRSLAVQLVLLPPHAEDSTPASPAQRVIDLDISCGVTVRRNRSGSRGSAREYFSLAGLPLTRSEPAREGWFLRGEQRGQPGTIAARSFTVTGKLFGAVNCCSSQPAVTLTVPIGLLPPQQP